MLKKTKSEDLKKKGDNVMKQKCTHFPSLCFCIAKDEDKDLKYL